MKECCTVDNLNQSTSDGELNARVNVLVCRTCGHQESYVYQTNHPDNALFSYCRFVELRIGIKQPVFSEKQQRHNL